MAAGPEAVSSAPALPEEALEIATRLGTSIHAVLTDIVMPKIRGTELAKRLRKMLPGVKIVYMSGYLDVKGTDMGSVIGTTVLQKPFTKEELITKMADVLSTAIISTPEASSTVRRSRSRPPKIGPVPLA